MDDLKKKQLQNYNPSDVGVVGSVFGLPYTLESAELVLVPMPWDVTVSYGSGTAKGPQAILEASPQLDLEIFGVKDAWKVAQYMMPHSTEIEKLSKELRGKAEPYIRSLEDPNSETDCAILKEVNEGCKNLVFYLKKEALQLLNQGKLVGVVGGDHSTPLGLIQALGEVHESFAILQIDAHMDLRESYEGFEYSHASIMNNALKINAVEKLVQVGIRDFCEEELNHLSIQNGSVKTFYDQEINDRLFHDDTWRDIVTDIIDQLPQKVYISFDIDGLDPKLCPSTGTPVPGGLEMQQMTYLISELIRSKRKIVGFDLSETVPAANDWDQNVAARILYQLGVFTVLSNNGYF